MATIHCLNVLEGDCAVIEHSSGHVTVIDVCNAKPENPTLEEAYAFLAETETGATGNFNQKKYPVNPISYLTSRGIWSVFRFILTHPDMDHLDGMKVFFKTFSPLNFWDTDNQEEKDFENETKYDEDDWLFYQGLRTRGKNSNPKRMTLYSGASGKYYNEDGAGKSGGDGLRILAPTPTLVRDANKCGDYNDCSYVILYRTSGRRILFGGDSHDETWKHILANHKNDVAGVDLLLAPHHGRKSGRSYDFLDVVKPKLTFFGNARSEHIAYGAWNYRKLPFITNNQAGSLIVDISRGTMGVYVANKEFARKANRNTFFSKTHHAYFYGNL